GRQLDGVWTMQDQEALNQFIEEENNGKHKDNKIPSSVTMRWDNNSRADFAARVTSALVNSHADQYEAALQAQRDRQKNDPTYAIKSPSPDGSKVAEMQFYLK